MVPSPPVETPCISYIRIDRLDARLASRLYQILDGLLTYSRVNDPTAAGGAGQPPENLNLGNEGYVKVKAGDNDKILGELDGKVSNHLCNTVTLLFALGGARQHAPI